MGPKLRRWKKVGAMNCSSETSFQSPKFGDERTARTDGFKL